MLKPATRLVVGTFLLLAPGALLAQGVNIEHKAVGCIVAGKYPKMNACFSPASQLARARVYFRPEEGPPNWYYVEMKSDAPCFSGILPKPARKLVGKNVLYYLNAFDQKFVENRTVDNSALVVKSEGECKKDIPVAPWLSSANVVVFPSLPAGFTAGGLGAGAVAAMAAGGAAVVGGGVAIANGGGGGSTPTTATTPTTTPATPTTTLPTTTTTVAEAPFQPRFKVTLTGIDCFTGAPLTQTFGPPFGALSACYDFFGAGGLGTELDMCCSDAGRPAPPYPKLFYGTSVDGVQTSGKCQTKLQLSIAGFTVLSVGSIGKLGIAPTSLPSRRTYTVVMAMNSDAPGNNPQAKQTFTITVEASFVLGFRSSRVGSLEPAGRRLAWVSQLDVPGASGQVVVNGSSVAFSGPGRSTALAVGRRGENRIEAQLVQGGGAPGTWRFEMGSTASLVPGSLRVLAGSVVEVSGDAIVFRLTGRAGERVVFTFRTGR